MDCLRDLERSNMEIVRRLLEEGYGQGLVSVLPLLIAPAYVGHFQIGEHYGPEGVRIDIAACRTAMPDLSVTIEDLFASGSSVARRFTLRGTVRRSPSPPGHRPIVLGGMAIDRLDGGLLVESWVSVESLPHGS